MKLAAWAVAFALLLLGGAVTFAIWRGEDTRERIVRVERTVDPCQRPKSDACQRRIRLVLRELVRRWPFEFRVRPDTPAGSSKTFTDSLQNSPSGGGGATGPPQGGGPVGRVRPPVERPAPPPTPTPRPPHPEPMPEGPLVELRAPAPVEACVGDLLEVNC